MELDRIRQDCVLGITDMTILVNVIWLVIKEAFDAVAGEEGGGAKRVDNPGQVGHFIVVGNPKAQEELRQWYS